MTCEIYFMIWMELKMIPQRGNYNFSNKSQGTKSDEHSHFLMVFLAFLVLNLTTITITYCEKSMMWSSQLRSF